MDVGLYGALHGGINLARTSANGPQENRRGITFGGGLEIPMGSSWYFQPEMSYVEKGSRAPLGDINSNSLTDAFLRYDFIEMPLLFKKKFGQADLAIELMGGPYVGFALTKAYVTESSTAGSTTTDLTSQLASLDYGLALGFGGDYRIANDTAIYFNARYMMGLANLDLSGSPTSVAMRSIFLVVGYRIMI